MKDGFKKIKIIIQVKEIYEQIELKNPKRTI